MSRHRGCRRARLTAGALLLATIVAGCGAGSQQPHRARSGARMPGHARGQTGSATAAPTATRAPATATGTTTPATTGSAPSALHVTVGHTPTTVTGITVRIRTGRGHTAYCATGPLGLRRCGRLTTTAASAVQVTIPTPRPGRWRLTITAPSHHPLHVERWVTNPGGAPVSLLTAGDSEMQIADDDIATDLAQFHVAPHADARQTTGLLNEWYFNWFNGIARDEGLWHPQITVMFLGANDGFGITAGGQSAACCGEAWSQLYAQKVERFSRTVIGDGGGVIFWTTLPAPLPATFRTLFNGVNRALGIARAAMPTDIGLIDANALFTPGNVYRDTMSFGGQQITIHEPDGVHLAAGADIPYAALVTQTLVRDGLLRRR